MQSGADRVCAPAHPRGRIAGILIQRSRPHEAIRELLVSREVPVEFRATLPSIIEQTWELTGRKMGGNFPRARHFAMWYPFCEEIGNGSTNRHPRGLGRGSRG